MYNFPWGQFFIAGGILFTLFHKRCAKATCAFWNMECVGFRKKYFEMGFLVVGIIFALAGILMFIMPSIFN